MTHIITSLSLCDNSSMEGDPVECINSDDSMKPAQATGSPSMPDSEKKMSSPWIEKYEMGTGKDRINIRIFKEPDPGPVRPEA